MKLVRAAKYHVFENNSLAFKFKVKLNILNI